MEERREVWYLQDSDQVVLGIHPKRWCSGTCVIHRPSKHQLRDLPLAFDMATKAFYRTCGHKQQHHDPDERTYWTNQLERDASRRGGGGKLAQFAMTKLSDWECPNCICGCCDLTRIV